MLLAGIHNNVEIGWVVRMAVSIPMLRAGIHLSLNFFHAPLCVSIPMLRAGIHFCLATSTRPRYCFNSHATRGNSHSVYRICEKNSCFNSHATRGNSPHHCLNVEILLKFQFPCYAREFTAGICDAHFISFSKVNCADR